MSTMDLSPSYRELALFLFLFLILRVIYLQEPYSNASIGSEKVAHGTPVENWFLNEVGVNLKFLREFQALGVCVNEQNIALCLNDITLNTKANEKEHPHLLELLKVISPNGALIKHLVYEIEKKKRNIVLYKWLRDNNLMTSSTETQLTANAIYSLDDLAKVYLRTTDSQSYNENIARIQEAVHHLSKIPDLNLLENRIFEELVKDVSKSYKEEIHSTSRRHTIDSMNYVSKKINLKQTDNGVLRQHFVHISMALILSAVVWYIWDLGVTPNEVLFDGVPLWKSRTKIIWSRNISEEHDRQTRGLLGHDISMSTSNTKSVIVSFFTLKGEPVQDVFQNPESNLEAEVWYEFGSDQVKIEANIAELASNAETETENTYNNEIQIIFSGQRVGKYSVTLRSNNKLVRGFPTVGNVHPGKADHKSTCIVENRSSTLLITADCRGHETIKVEPRDEYGNKIVNIVDLENLADKFQLVLWKRIDASYQRDDMIINDHHSVVYQGSGLCGDCIHISLSFIIGQEGWYTAQVLLNGRQINMPKMLTLIVISVQDRERVDRIVSNDELTSGSTYFEGEIVGQDGHLFERSKKCKKVYVYLTGKQLIIKEYFLRFIPIKLYTFRLTPTTKINLVHNPSEGMNNESMTNINEYQSIYSTVIEIDDGCQCRPQLLFKDNKFGQQKNGGTLFAACYHKRLLQRIGGSETFLDKQNIFNKKLVEYHQEKGNVRNKLLLKVERWCIVHSSFQVTKWLSDSQWIHLFEIEFEGEPGIDQGGIRREWFEILCREIFKPTFNLFVQAEEGSDAVLPNSKPYQDNFGKNALKMYKFAGKIVGKCLLESAHGSTYRQQLPVRLAKSFLALIVGLRVQFKHFSYDTPEFYATKVRSILTGNVDDEDGGMNDIVFSEEEYMSSESVSQNVKIVDLKPNGSQTKVTESNKHEYLDLLAQYKLCDRFKEKTAAFLDGLHRLVPDSLLSLFDEHELELLLCGIREYSLQDLKKYHIVVGGIFGGPSAKILNWFWLILASFTREQMARLVQFTTGSSQLPHGGFEKLQPMFQIMGSGEKNSLPTAHTCFNMICLPDHNEFNNFEQALLTAITEGNEGFGLV